MKKEKGYWVDANNNRWDVNYYDKDEAVKYSASLKDCTNCTNCIDCRNCTNCTNCIDCTDCTNCRYCTDCTNCTNCIDCRNCTNCIDCRNCRNCIDCTDCTNCRNCIDCTDCTNCIDCIDCRNCIDCIDCTNCIDCINCRNCIDCIDYQENPKRYTGNRMGRDKRQTTVYWVKDNVQVICGCFKGNLQEFKSKVKEVHGDNEHGKDYQNYIKIVETIMEMEK